MTGGAPESGGVVTSLAESSLIRSMEQVMQPQLRRLGAFNVSGLTARTSSRDEIDPRAARIFALWNRFFDERIYEKTPHRIVDVRLYGVYSAYETGANGAFDITTGVAVADGPEAVCIEGGDYLVFTGEGAMPQIVLSVWEAIWQYFDDHPERRRRYRSDFEAYSGPEQVAIHIGIESD
jgi:predicted transcriptional regulator YdeE